MDITQSSLPVTEGDPGELDALYSAWQVDLKGARPTPLKQWLATRPEHTDSFVAWTAEIVLMEGAETGSDNTELVARVQEIGERTLARYRLSTQANAPEPIRSLKEAAGRRGITLKSLAEALELGLPIIAKLEQRLLRLESIPGRLIDGLAENLQVSGEQVRAYLAQPASLSSSALYRADSAPRAGTQEEFTQAVKGCAGMTPVGKQTWIKAATTVPETSGSAGDENGPNGPQESD